MRRHYSHYSRHRSPSRHFPRYLIHDITRYVTRYAIGIFTFAACLLVGCGVLLTYSLMTPATTSASAARPLQTSTATPTQVTVPTEAVSTATKSVQPSATITATVASTVSSTPTLVPSTPQTSQNGVFSLSSGGPLPVSESIFHPTNIARTTLDGTLISIYAGSLAADPQQGVLCVLRENLTTGQFSIQMYQSPHRNGPLTIVAIQNSTLKIVDSTAQGTFDLISNQFQW